MRKSEENNKFRKKENAKSSMVRNRNVRKNTSAHRENVTLQKMWRLPVSGNGL